MGLFEDRVAASTADPENQAAFLEGYQEALNSGLCHGLTGGAVGDAVAVNDAYDSPVFFDSWRNPQDQNHPVSKELTAA